MANPCCYPHFLLSQHLEKCAEVPYQEQVQSNKTGFYCCHCLLSLVDPHQHCAVFGLSEEHVNHQWLPDKPKARPSHGADWGPLLCPLLPQPSHLCFCGWEVQEASPWRFQKICMFSVKLQRLRGFQWTQPGQTLLSAHKVLTVVFSWHCLLELQVQNYHPGQVT